VNDRGKCSVRKRLRVLRWPGLFATARSRERTTRKRAAPASAKKRGQEGDYRSWPGYSDVRPRGGRTEHPTVILHDRTRQFCALPHISRTLTPTAAGRNAKAGLAASFSWC